MDNGPEMTSRALADWANDIVGLVLIPPGEPWKNGYVESFHSRQRGEFLNINTFTTVLQARVELTDWHHEYNHLRRHSRLGYKNRDGMRSKPHLHHTRLTPNQTGTKTGDRSRGLAPDKPCVALHGDLCR